MLSFISAAKRYDCLMKYFVISLPSPSRLHFHTGLPRQRHNALMLDFTLFSQNRYMALYTAFSSIFQLNNFYYYSDASPLYLLHYHACDIYSLLPSIGLF